MADGSDENGDVLADGGGLGGGNDANGDLGGEVNLRKMRRRGRERREGAGWREGEREWTFSWGSSSRMAAWDIFL